MWQQKLADEFNRSFNEPFMPEGFCEARGKDGVLRIRLGDRDVAFDELGNSIGSGGNVGSGKEWEVGRRIEPLKDIIDEG